MQAKRALGLVTWQVHCRGGGREKTGCLSLVAIQNRPGRQPFKPEVHLPLLSWHTTKCPQHLAQEPPRPHHQQAGQRARHHAARPAATQADTRAALEQPRQGLQGGRGLQLIAGQEALEAVHQLVLDDLFHVLWGWQHSGRSRNTNVRKTKGPSTTRFSGAVQTGMHVGPQRNVAPATLRCHSRTKLRNVIMGSLMAISLKSCASGLALMTAAHTSLIRSPPLSCQFAARSTYASMPACGMVSQLVLLKSLTKLVTAPNGRRRAGSKQAASAVGTCWPVSRLPICSLLVTVGWKTRLGTQFQSEGGNRCAKTGFGESIAAWAHSPAPMGCVKETAGRRALFSVRSRRPT